jgi:hypothetical protein
MTGQQPETAAMVARIEDALRRNVYLTGAGLANLAGFRGPHWLMIGENAIAAPLASGSAIAAIENLQQRGECHFWPRAGRWVAHRRPHLVPVDLVRGPSPAPFAPRGRRPMDRRRVRR